MGADLVTYAVTPRVICNAPKITDASSWILDEDVRREFGLAYVVKTFGLGTLARSLTLAHSDLMRFRNEVRAWSAGLTYALPKMFQPARPPRAYTPNEMHPPRRPLGPLWSYHRCSFDTANPQIQALETIVEMCAASGRCLLYHGPINPAGLTYFDNGLLAEFGRFIGRLTSENAVPFRNYTFSIGIRGFNSLKQADGLPIIDPVHLNAQGRSRLASLISADAARMLTTRVAAPAARTSTGG
jgi:hypothetical protein